MNWDLRRADVDNVEFALKWGQIFPVTFVVSATLAGLWFYQKFVLFPAIKFFDKRKR